MCLAIPGRIVELTGAGLAKVDVAGVRRAVDVSLLEDARMGDWVLIHVGFALSRIDEDEARATLELLERMGAEYDQQLAELKESA